MRKSFFGAIAGLGFALATSAANAAFVDFIEAANDTDPVFVSTNLLGGVIAFTAEGASVTGFHTPAISAFPVEPGSRFAVLFEPGTLNLMVSDYVLLVAADVVIGTDGITPSQELHVSFFSEDVRLDELVLRLGRVGFAFSGGVEEDGTLQDISGLLGSLSIGPTGVPEEGLRVRVQSDHVETQVPEPTGLLLLGVALAGLGATRSRKVAA